MALPVYQSAGAGATTTTATLTVPYPASIAAGDFLICHTGTDTAACTQTDLSGWTQWAYNSSLTFAAYVWARYADGTESGNLSVSWSDGTSTKTGRMYRFTGVDAAYPFESLTTVAGVGSSTTVNDTGVTTTSTDRLCLQLVSFSQNSTITAFTGETGGDWTEATAEYSGNPSLSLQTAGLASAGTIDGGTATLGFSSQWYVTGVALMPSTFSTGSSDSSEVIVPTMVI